MTCFPHYQGEINTNVILRSASCITLLKLEQDDKSATVNFSFSKVTLSSTHLCDAQIHSSSWGRRYVWAHLPPLSPTICTKAHTNHWAWGPFQTTLTLPGLVLNHFLNSLDFILPLIFLGCWLCNLLFHFCLCFALELVGWNALQSRHLNKGSRWSDSMCWINECQAALLGGKAQPWDVVSQWEASKK